jgi:hypothetical protein
MYNFLTDAFIFNITILKWNNMNVFGTSGNLVSYCSLNIGPSSRYGAILYGIYFQLKKLMC